MSGAALDRTLRVALPVALGAVLLGFWSWYVRQAGVSPLILPAPERILVAFAKQIVDPRMLYHAWVTIAQTVAGFAIAMVVGIALGTAMAKVRTLEWALQPYIIALQIVPKIALAPLFILWFGFGMESKVVIAALLAFFPVYANTLLAMKSVDPGDREVFASMRASPMQRFFLLEMPSALPLILTGAEVAIVLAIIGAVVGEFIGGNEGLGQQTIAKLQMLQVDELFGVVLLLTLIGLAMYLAVALLRRRLAPWHGASGAAEP